MPTSSPSSTPASTRIPAGQPEALDASRLREERPRILGVEPHLDRVALERGRLGQRAALGELELRGDEVEPRDELRHGMLDLDAPVQLQEEEVAPVEHELGGARAPVGDRLRERARRRPPSRARSPGSSAGDGDSSSTFWCRRWTEHSRSPSAIARARARRRAAGSRRAAAARRSARRTRCRRRTRPLPRARAASSASSSSSAERTTRIPRPPPPAAAFTSSGNPRLAGSPSSSTGTPASRATRFAASLSPPARSASGDGPTKTRPAASTASAKSAFSERNP